MTSELLHFSIAILSFTQRGASTSTAGSGGAAPGLTAGYVPLPSGLRAAGRGMDVAGIVSFDAWWSWRRRCNVSFHKREVRAGRLPEALGYVHRVVCRIQQGWGHLSPLCLRSRRVNKLQQ